MVSLRSNIIIMISLTTENLMWWWGSGRVLQEFSGLQSSKFYFVRWDKISAHFRFLFFFSLKQLTHIPTLIQCHEGRKQHLYNSHTWDAPEVTLYKEHFEVTPSKITVDVLQDDIIKYVCFQRPLLSLILYLKDGGFRTWLQTWCSLFEGLTSLENLKQLFGKNALLRTQVFFLVWWIQMRQVEFWWWAPMWHSSNQCYGYKHCSSGKNY